MSNISHTRFSSSKIIADSPDEKISSGNGPNGENPPPKVNEQLEFPFVRRNRPRIWHPTNKLDSQTHLEIGVVIEEQNGWFVRGDSIVTIRLVPSGFEYSGEVNSKYKVVSHTAGFETLSALAARADLEQYIIPMAFSGRGKEKKAVQKSFPIPFCYGLIKSMFLRKALSHINRILTVPLPFRIAKSKELIYPGSGYDKRFGTYLIEGAPKLRPMHLEEAKRLIKHIYEEFPFTTEQSRCHAIARLLTPFARGFLGWTTRVPLWHYCANRPRAGKDYCAVIPMLLMEGHAYEDQPIGKDSSETAKRIISANRAGRQFMHFSNCQIYLQDEYLAQASTNEMIVARRLGSNEASSDLCIFNEAEYSISANIGLTYREDLGARMCHIEFAYYEEDENRRTFYNKYLHKDIQDNRSEYLSALNAVAVNWAKEGFPKGQTPFSSFPRYAEIVGGMMMAADLGDCCLPFKSKYKVSGGGDRKAEAIIELFRVCCERLGNNEWVNKKEIYKCVNEAKREGNEVFDFFGDLYHGSSDQAKFGRMMREYKDRIMGGIHLLIDDEDTNSTRHRFKFTRI